METKQVKMHCNDCGYHCKTEMTFPADDSHDYIKAVISNYQCHVIYDEDCNWIWENIEGANDGHGSSDKADEVS